MDWWLDREAAGDAAGRDALVSACVGNGRTGSAMLREGNRAEVALVARTFGLSVAGTVRLWPVELGNARPALMLGPLAVSPELRGRGVGSSLVRAGLDEARRAGFAAVVLVGDPRWYGAMGFVPLHGVSMPAAASPGRELLGAEITPGGLLNVSGTVARPRSLAAAA